MIDSFFLQLAYRCWVLDYAPVVPQASKINEVLCLKDMDCSTDANANANQTVCLNNDTLCTVELCNNSDPLKIKLKFQKLVTSVDEISGEPGGHEVLITGSFLRSSTDVIICVPYCIGYNGCYAVLRYVSIGYPESKFAIVNTWTGAVLTFMDSDVYFMRVLTKPLECILEPLSSPAFADSIRCIVRFPQSELTSYSWSKMLLFAHNFRTSESKLARAFRDRRWQGVAFHPQGHQLCLSLVNTFGHKCRIMKLDTEYFHVIGQRDFRSRSPVDNHGCVTQSKLQYNHDGESIIVISTLNSAKGSVCLLQFDSASLACLRYYRSYDLMPGPILPDFNISFTISPCGSCVKVWQWENQCGSFLLAMTLAKPASLSSMCRTVLRSKVLLQNVSKLPLPLAMQLYVMFQPPVSYNVLETSLNGTATGASHSDLMPPF